MAITVGDTMRVYIGIALVILGVILPVGQPRAEADDFALACVFRPQEWRTFVVSGKYSKGEATISRPDGTLSRAFVAFDFDRGGAPLKLVVLVKGQGRLGEWRDLYVIDTALGTFSHVNEIYADGPDKQPSMAVHGGTCTPINHE
jgi:hypothetical protein